MDFMWATSIEERLADFVIRVFDAMGICIWTCNDTKNIRKFAREKSSTTCYAVFGTINLKF